MILLVIAAISLAAWAYLLLFHDQYWWGGERLEVYSGGPDWPSVAIVIPARDEAENIGHVIGAHMACAYPGAFSITLVDDGSTDGTAQVAHDASAINASRATLSIIPAPTLPAGWSGKLNAVNAGVTAATQSVTTQSEGRETPENVPEFLLLTDADIVLAPSTLTRLVAKARAEDLALVSLMARLDNRGFWGGLLIPAFVYFFQKLYPFPGVNNPAQKRAAAAGGCMLVRTDVLEAAGGIPAIHGALIDDCALADLIKNNRPATGANNRRAIWLGLAKDEAISLRDNRDLGSIWSMVARTAYDQLRHSPALLGGSVLGMMVLYVAPPAMTFLGLAAAVPGATAMGFLAWLIMAVTYRPTLAVYGQSAHLALALPVAGILYTLMTLDSARRHWMGKGGQWKGRTYSARP